MICMQINSSAYYIHGCLALTTAAAVDHEQEAEGGMYLKIVPCKLTSPHSELGKLLHKINVIRYILQVTF